MVNAETKEKNRGRLFVVSGPSGSGKSTLCRALVEQTNVKLSVSATTRTQSAREIEGKDYFFLTTETFERKITQGDFLEYARVFDHYYGTPAAPVQESLEQGQTVILEIDVQGALQVFEKIPEAIGIFVKPPNDEELRRRLSDRGRDDEATIEKRLAKAHWEIDKALASNRYQYVIVNDNLQRAMGEIVQLVNKAGNR